MKTDGKKATGKLEDNPLWREACDLAEYMYGKLSEFPDEEKWETTRKLRTSANDLMFYVGQALTNTVPVGAGYEWGNASRALGGIKTMYRFAGRQHFIELEPEIMVRIDKFMEQIQSEIAQAAEKTRLTEKHQLDLWREQYKLWRKMNADDFHKPEGRQNED